MRGDSRVVDADGVRVERDPRVRVVLAGAAAVAVICVATVVALVVLGDRPPPETARAPVPVTVADAPRAPAPSQVRRRGADDAGAPAPSAGRARREERRAAARAAAPDGPRAEATLQDVLPYLPAGEAREGIALFPLPGTDPPKRGLVVPEDFVLPEGFLRHYQATDDGQELPPILMLHPDYELLDAAGEPIALPGGVVPPELAPPGMPREMLALPEPVRPAD